MPLRLIDSSVWIAFLRPRPDPRIVRTVQRALDADEAAVAAPIIVEVLSGIRDTEEYLAREADFRTLPLVAVDGEAGYMAARIAAYLASTGRAAKTVDLLLAGAAVSAGVELWTLPDDHYRDMQTATAHLWDPPTRLRVHFLP
jgi:hypothetical protein